MKYAALFLSVSLVGLAMVLAAILLVSPAAAVDEHREGSIGNHGFTVHSSSYSDDNVKMDFENGSIYFTNKRHRGDEVEITEDHELFVNGEKVKLTKEQSRLVAEFYDSTNDLIVRAKEIGIEGAKVGVEGAKVGMKAVHGVLKAMFTSYTLDEMERDIEREAAKVESKADKLEARADGIEEMADHVEDLYDEMFDSIPALEDLDW